VELSLRHYVGLDLGQARDYSALAVIERVDIHNVLTTFRFARSSPGSPPPTDVRYRESLFDVRRLERLALGTAYPVIVRHVETLMRDPRLVAPVLVIDKTGVGSPIADLFRERKMEMTSITITAGAGTTQIGGAGLGVPKRDLVYSLVALLQQGKLRIASRLRFAETLVQELLDFRVEISESGRDTYNAREGTHDDLLLATALAAWKAHRDAEPLHRPARITPPTTNLFPQI
jgi:hypothetical protein